MTRVAVDCHMVGQPSAGDAGNARYAAGLVGAMSAAAGPDDTVAALVAHAHGEELAGAVLRGVPTANARRILRAGPQALRELDADAAVFTYVAPPRAPCPVLLAVHDASFITHPEWLRPRARAVLRALVPGAVRRARLVLALSETAKADLADALALPPERVRVVSPSPGAAFRPEPVTAVAAPALAGAGAGAVRDGAGVAAADGGAGGDCAAARVRARFGLERYVLAVGDLSPRKNLPALGEAVRMLGRDGPVLALAGRPGRGAGAILRAAGARWLGHVGDEALADLYRAAAVTVQPSLYEGFGLTLLEGMACGSPTVAADRGAAAEVAGDAALLVEPTPAGLAEGIRAALEPATAARLAEAGPVRAARYRPDDMGAAAWRAVREAAG